MPYLNSTANYLDKIPRQLLSIGPVARDVQRGDAACVALIQVGVKGAKHAHDIESIVPTRVV